MTPILGIGVDLTQHIPLVSVALNPPGVPDDREVDSSTLAQHWPPRVEMRGSFCAQLPCAVLPLIPGEPLLIGDAAARHRRSTGQLWPPEAQVPYDNDPSCGVARIPLVAAWLSLLPAPGETRMMERRDDPEFKWRPSDREHAVHAGLILAASVRAFLKAASLPLGTCRTCIVVPDSLDEAGQQILLDSLSRVGLSSDQVHLIPRPLAVALRWCHDQGTQARPRLTESEEGERIGRLRILTMGMDVWEAVVLEVRARRYEGRLWRMPVRDRSQPIKPPPELPSPGILLALGMARASTQKEPLAWWHRLFASDWLARRLLAGQEPTPEEVESFREVAAPNPPEYLRKELAVLGALPGLRRASLQSLSNLRASMRERWEAQERLLNLADDRCVASLCDGVFSGLRIEGDLFSPLAGSENDGRASVQLTSPTSPAAVRGAALAAAAIAHDLPCYRETLLPLDLYVLGRDENDDPKPRWQELVVAHTAEAGRGWTSPEPLTGLRIPQGQECLSLPLRRVLRGKSVFKSVSTELTEPVDREEPVLLEVRVRPGQGFAHVHITSKTPGVFAARLDWQTMKDCPEPTPPPLAYVPGVTRVLPDREMFVAAQPALEEALNALQRERPAATERLRDVITFLNKWPLAHTVEWRRGRRVDRDFMTHYGVIGSDGRLDAVAVPYMAKALRDAIGERFSDLVIRRHTNSLLGRTLLRAGGWFYLAIPKECLSYLHARISEAARGGARLSVVELHAVGLSLAASRDIKLFYTLLVPAVTNPAGRPNHWLRAVRNICRFRNHALDPAILPDGHLDALVARLFALLQEQARQHNFHQIFRNCLETIPFLLKRRRYDPSFLAPETKLAKPLIRFLEELDSTGRWTLPHRLQKFPSTTVKFLRSEATESDLEQLLVMGEEEEDDDHD